LQVAQVSIDGFLNDVPFCIKRIKTATKTGLYFYLDSNDLTTQSAKETQALINDMLGIGPEIIARTMFHGQHALNNILEASDIKLKEELSLVVPLSIWQDSQSLARQKSRAAAKEVASIEGMIRVRTEDQIKLRARRESADHVLRKEQRELDSLISELSKESLHLQHDLMNSSSLEDILEKASKDVAAVEKERQALVQEKNDALLFWTNVVNRLDACAKKIGKLLDDLRLEHNTNTIKHKAAEEKVRELQLLMSRRNNLMDAGPMESPKSCPTCGQVMGGLALANFVKKVEEDLAKAIQRHLELEQLTTVSSQRIATMEAELNQGKVDLEVAQKGLQEETNKWDSLLVEIDEKLTYHRAKQNEALQFLTLKSRNTKRDLKLESIRAATEAVKTVEMDLHEIDETLTKLQTHLGAEAKVVNNMNLLSDAFGTRGIQTYVLQNAVTVLSTLSQAYLDELSDGAQRLELSLEASDRIHRQAFVRAGDGEYRERPLGSLSGGQWRRCSLALTLGFAELVARRGHLRPSLLVLDEPLTHLDSAGRANVGRLLRKMLRKANDGVASGSMVSAGLAYGLSVSTILIILQDLAAEELAESFDYIDEVIRIDGISKVMLDEKTQ
jgi:DNA repair exonuclease SbcCD ATPase subunit